ncbi:Rossmann-like domain-containing protein [Desulfolutivibrio sp.]|uniref:Rossmann-like domain-containing protein n=1 Tax=Desulfolutivibrio sp. TaxID=2773296 RepID=UPI002F966042
MRTSQSAIAAAVRQEAAAQPDEAVGRVVAGALLVGVCATRTGLCTNVAGEGFAPASGGTVHGLLEGLELTGLDGRAASLAVAAAGALLPPPPVSAKKAQDLILDRGRGRRVAVVGHFPFVEKMGPAFASFSVLERAPRPGDLPAAQAETVLPEAQVVAITASALANGSLGGLLDLCSPGAFVLLVGPSVPFAGCLFDFGVDVLCGNVVTDAQAVLDGVARGLPYRALQGLSAVCAVRNDFVRKTR